MGTSKSCGLLKSCTRTRSSEACTEIIYHSSADKLFRVIRRANIADATEEIRGRIDAVQMVCDVCQREADAPRSFKVSLTGETYVLKACVSLDIMYLDRR